MSAATASSTERVTLYVRLVNEAVDVWRPVGARRIGETTFQIEPEPSPPGETWSFQPGDIVVAEHRRLDDRQEAPLIAVALASHFDEPSWSRPRRFG